MLDSRLRVLMCQCEFIGCAQESMCCTVSRNIEAAGHELNTSVALGLVFKEAAVHVVHVTHG